MHTGPLGLPVVRTGTWYVKLAGSTGHMQVHVLRQLPVQVPGTATWQGTLDPRGLLGHQDRNLVRQTSREHWMRAGPLGVPVIRTGTWHGKLAGSAGCIQVHLVCRWSGQGPGMANWQVALDACRSTWSAGGQDRDLARQTGR